jgi:hypothetical protein
MPGRRRMKTGFALSTWCNRVDELAEEVWRYHQEGEITLAEADWAVRSLGKIRYRLKASYNKRRGFSPDYYNGPAE